MMAQRRDWSGQEPFEWMAGRHLDRPVPSSVERQWHIGATFANQGRAVVDALHRIDIDAYQPMETVWKRDIQKRRYKAYAPIFGRYLFVGVQPGRGTDELHEIAGLQGLLSITVRGAEERRPAEVAAEIVTSLREAETLGLFDKTKTSRIEVTPGAPVNIVGGKFAGYAAKVIRETKTKGRWVLMTQFLGGGTMEIDEEKLEIIA